MIEPTKEGTKETGYLIPYPDLFSFLLNMDKAVYTNSIGQITSSTDIIKARREFPDFTVYTIILLCKPNNIAMIMTMKDKELFQDIS